MYEVHGVVTGPPPTSEWAPDIDLEYSQQLLPNELHARFKLTFKEPDAMYVADMAAVYSFAEELEIAEEVVIDFAERVAFMTTFPFLRESVATTAARMQRNVPTLGIMRPGDFKIGTPDEDAAQEAPDGASQD